MPILAASLANSSSSDSSTTILTALARTGSSPSFSSASKASHPPAATSWRLASAHRQSVNSITARDTALLSVLSASWSSRLKAGPCERTSAPPRRKRHDRGSRGGDAAQPHKLRHVQEIRIRADGRVSGI
eukprot:767779-Hanusia_phi.AAC.3